MVIRDLKDQGVVAVGISERSCVCFRRHLLLIVWNYKYKTLDSVKTSVHRLKIKPNLKVCVEVCCIRLNKCDAENSPITPLKTRQTTPLKCRYLFEKWFVALGSTDRNLCCFLLQTPERFWGNLVDHFLPSIAEILK
jgi:hypothetical protein